MNAGRHPLCVRALAPAVERESGHWVGTEGFVPARDVAAHPGYAAEPRACVQALTRPFPGSTNAHAFIQSRIERASHDT
ncbi:MAG TPA: hypothetical protein VEY92_12445 [Pseudoxanthomonas sp.]|nr:hypothetical protein [Pseudoxanthomonas sp.]